MLTVASRLFKVARVSVNEGVLNGKSITNTGKS